MVNGLGKLRKSERREKKRESEGFLAWSAVDTCQKKLRCWILIVTLLFDASYPRWRTLHLDADELWQGWSVEGNRILRNTLYLSLFFGKGSKGNSARLLPHSVSGVHVKVHEE